MKTNPSSTVIQFDHLPLLVGVVHKWIGNNNPYHGETPLYSFSWLQGARRIKEGLIFPKGAEFFISAWDSGLFKSVLKGALESPELFAGMQVMDIQIQLSPQAQNGTRVFTVASPVLAKYKNGESVKHVLYNDPEVNGLLTQSVVRKMKIAGLDDAGLSVAFDPEYRSAHTKMVNYRGVKNRASVCPVVVSGSQEQLDFVWHVGVGHSTGIGFGALK